MLFYGAFLPKPAFSDISLLAHFQPRWEESHDENQQTLQIRVRLTVLLMV